MSDSTDVEITVTDVNDNPPKFTQESYTVSVSEDVPIGTSILQVILKMCFDKLKDILYRVPNLFNMTLYIWNGY